MRIALASVPSSAVFPVGKARGIYQWQACQCMHAHECRCGWDCATGGYDDDSQPMPEHRAKWEEFVAQIRAGRTPAYEGRVEGSRRRPAAGKERKAKSRG